MRVQLTAQQWLELIGLDPLAARHRDELEAELSAAAVRARRKPGNEIRGVAA